MVELTARRRFATCVDTDGDGICDREDDDDDGDGVDDLSEMSCVNTVSATSSLPPHQTCHHWDQTIRPSAHLMTGLGAH